MAGLVSQSLYLQSVALTSAGSLGSSSWLAATSQPALSLYRACVFIRARVLKSRPGPSQRPQPACRSPPFHRRQRPAPLPACRSTLFACRSTLFAQSSSPSAATRFRSSRVCTRAHPPPRMGGRGTTKPATSGTHSHLGGDELGPASRMDRNRILVQRRPRGCKKCWHAAVPAQHSERVCVESLFKFLRYQKAAYQGTPPAIPHPESLAAQSYNTEALLPGSGLGPNCMQARYWPHVFVLVLLDRWPVTPSTRHKEGKFHK